MEKTFLQWKARAAGLFLLVSLYHFSALVALAADLSTGEAFRKQLRETRNITWSGQPLREALHTITQEWRVAVFLDRRVDPDQLIQFSSTDKSLDVMLQDLAAALRLEVSFVDSIVYLGPRGTSARVATLAEVRFDEAQVLGARLRDRLSRRSAMTWEDVVEPRELISDLATSVGLKITNPERIPHDLWAHSELPPTPLTHRLVLLLAGFDLTYRLSDDKSALLLEPFPESVELDRTYTVRGNAAQKLNRLQTAFPQAHLELVGTRIRVRGTAEDHYAIRRALAGASPPTQSLPPGTNVEKRFTLHSTNPFGALSRALAKKLDLNITLDPDLEKLETPVTIDVKNVTLEQLLDALVKPVGATYELQGKELTIRAGR